uniref:Neuroligin-4, Y-linked-like n=1 Tax=Diabrotica virgifera virgifera TaxID=50390 RepID=A0A6P7FGZ9_DIAVI
MDITEHNRSYDPMPELEFRIYLVTSDLTKYGTKPKDADLSQRLSLFSGSSESLRPVIVYIHGESFEWNSGNPYDGSVIASYADLVVITINYRLGILGFLNANPAPHLKARVANYGLMDQIAALHWIQQNVALFGGDPNNVTLAGHGSGAACINFLMISPTVMPGLFHRTILLSGSALSSWALRMGTVHGEELPYIFGAPLVDGFNHFSKNYTKSELALSESFLIYIANFVRTGNPNENHKQDPVLAISRERNRFRSILWDEYDSVHQKYLELGMKPRMKNHFRAHQLSVWLRLIPELHRAGMEDVVARHNLFRNHNSAELYEGAVRPDPLSRISYYDPTMELIRRRPNSSLTTLEASTTIETMVTTCVNIVSSGNYNHHNFQNHNNSTDTLASLEAAGYAAYSTALSVTIAIGCSLLILNVLIFAGVYYQRDKTRMEVKNLQQQQSRNQAAFETISKHQHHLGYSQNTNVIVDVEQDTSALILTNAQQDQINKMHQRCAPNANTILKAPPPSPNIMLQNCMTLPKNTSLYNYQHQGCVTLPKNLTLINNTQCTMAEMQQQGLVQPPNGNATMPLGVPKPPPPPRARSPESQPLLTHNNADKCNMRVPHAAMSEMRV